MRIQKSPDTCGRGLSEERKQHCEGLFSVKECLETLNGMTTEKKNLVLAGTDGLPCEFCKVFWKDMGETLTEALNFSYQTGKLAVSQRQELSSLYQRKTQIPT